jgi:hypothetical protein
MRDEMTRVSPAEQSVLQQLLDNYIAGRFRGLTAQITTRH